MMHRFHSPNWQSRSFVQSYGGLGSQPARLARVLESHVNKIASITYTQIINSQEAQETQQHKIQTIRQHYNSYMYSIDLRRLLSLQVSHIYHSNVGRKSGILPKVNFLEKGRSVSFKIQGIEGETSVINYNSTTNRLVSYYTSVWS